MVPRRFILTLFSWIIR